MGLFYKNYTIDTLSKYRVEFACIDGRKGLYIGDTVEELHKTIDSDVKIEESWLRDTLKYGYFDEFRNKSYETKQYVIDNCMAFIWTVREC